MPTHSYNHPLAAAVTMLLLAACGDAETGEAGSGPPGQPSRLLAVSLNRQVGVPDEPVPSRPTVVVTDARGTPVAGVPIEFEVTAGGGTVDPPSGTSGANGQLQAEWHLGPSGTQELRARIAGTTSSGAVPFTAVFPSHGGYQIDLRLLSSATDAQWTAFTAAAARIEEFVVGALSTVDLSGRRCDGTPLSGTVRGLQIVVRLQTIDGRGGILGQAGPCIVRSSSGLPAVGVMEFDTADLAALETGGTLRSTILHEMLHIVGFGFWDPPLLTGAGTLNSSFTGANAVAAATRYNGAPSSWTSVPVENCEGFRPTQCGIGTRDSHWRESVFRNELMTGYLSGTTQPLSRTTIASLADLGYTVDLEAEDPFDLRVMSLFSSDPDPEALPLGDDVLRLPIELVP
ncbi:MAG TPA: Ig-like domain-containing protein [Anaeromyxobacter sp.]|nr:Ig-like domain-containing protein [Anaeromyxobacter sp.]